MSETNSRTLYVCRQNIGRSQMAMEFHNQVVPDGAESAGFAVEVPEQAVEDWEGSANVLEAMKEVGIDMSQNRRRQLTREIMSKFSHLIILSEVGVIQTYVCEHPDWRHWETPDPKNKNLTDTRVIRDSIQAKVQDFIESDSA